MPFFSDLFLYCTNFDALIVTGFSCAASVIIWYCLVPVSRKITLLPKSWSKKIDHTCLSLEQQSCDSWGSPSGLWLLQTTFPTLGKLEPPQLLYLCTQVQLPNWQNSNVLISGTWALHPPFPQMTVGSVPSKLKKWKKKTQFSQHN